MFYSVDLLTLRRNGKFAKCWLAANFPPKIFHNKFRRQTIAAIDVAKTCEELIVHASTHSYSRRFSLYLSSQLMFGVTRICYYQADSCLKHQWELWISSNAGRLQDVEDGEKKKSRKNIPDFLEDPTQLPFVEPSLATLITRNMFPNINSITLPSDSHSIGGYDRMMQDPDWLNFGALTEAQMDQLLEHGGLYFDSPESTQIRVLPGIGCLETSRTYQPPFLSMLPETLKYEAIDLEQVSGAEVTVNEIPLPDIPETPASTEVLQPHEREIGPNKRHSSFSSYVQTPSKRRRAFGTEYNVAVVPLHEQLPTRTAAESSNSVLSLESLDSSVFRLQRTKKKPRKLIIDTHTKLPHTEDIGLLIPENRRIVIPLLMNSVAKLFTTPSTELAWGKILLGHYGAMIVEATPQPILDTSFRGSRRIPRLTPPIAGPPEEEVRAPEVSSSEQLAELSKEVFKKSTFEDTSKSDQTKSLEQASIDDKLMLKALPPLVEGPNDVAGLFGQVTNISGSLEDKQQQPLPEVSDLPQIVRSVLRDWTENGQLRSSRFSSTCATPEKSVILMASKNITREDQDPSRSRCGTTWVKADILGTLEVLWLQKRVVEFRDICPSSSCTRRDACQVFGFLLELQKSNDVRLTQAGPYGIVYIQGYASSF